MTAAEPATEGWNGDRLHAVRPIRIVVARIFAGICIQYSYFTDWIPGS